MREESRVSERRACGLLRMHRGSCRYRRRKRNDAALRVRLREIAGERPRFGYRRLHRMLRREQENGTAKWVVNHKRVYRIYREEGLAMRRKKRKRFRAAARVPLVLPMRENQMWTMDFTRDSLASGRKFRTLNLMDGFTREAPRIEVDTSLPGSRVVRMLEEVAQERGYPEAIQVDNGPAFTSWLGLCPDNRISGGKVLSVKTRRVKNRAATALRMAALSLHHSQSYLGHFYRRMRAKLGAP